MWRFDLLGCTMKVLKNNVLFNYILFWYVFVLNGRLKQMYHSAYKTTLEMIKVIVLCEGVRRVVFFVYVALVVGYV